MQQTQQPLTGLDQWDDFVKGRYKPGRKKEEFRQHNEDAPAGVKEFYRQNHINQTVDFVRAKRADYSALDKKKMGVWEALEYLDTLVDESDPDTDLTQVEHALQTAEACRADGRPDWFVLAGLVHDLGKVLCDYGEPQWAVVGDTFPVGCAWSDRIVYPKYFDANPDRNIPRYQTECGIYEPGCGIANVMLSFGHDEYIYNVAKDYLPEEALAILRYHSFYPWHADGAYTHFMNEQDRKMLFWVQEFNEYDLYSKGHAKPDAAALKPLYQELIAKYFPPQVRW